MGILERPTTFNPGEYIFREGDAGDCAYIIESGEVEITHDKGGRKLLLAKLSKGNILGEMAIIDNQPRLASAQAITPTVVTPIPLEYVAREIEDADPTLRLFLNLVMSRYRDLSGRIEQIFESLSPKNQQKSDEELNSDKREIERVLKQLLKMQNRIDSAVTKTSKSEPNSESTDLSVQMTKALVTQEQELKSALMNKEFCLLFQPIVDLSSNLCVGAEALVRWRHSDGEMLPPSYFIPRAERSGLILELGYWIAEEACRFQHHLAQEFGAGLVMNINLSGKQFEDPYLVQKLIEIIDKSEVPRDQIKFEVTESLLIDSPDLASQSLIQLKQAGIKLAIDDFGTGYSSFSYLTQFPFDTLKIDRSFVSTMTYQDKNDQIVKSLVNLAANLGMDVVAEGVESADLAVTLREYQTNYAQGWHFAKPLESDDFVHLLRSQQDSQNTENPPEHQSLSR